MVHHLANTNSIFSEFIAEIRDVNIQKDSLRFRRNLERIGEVFAYEISKTLPFNEVDVQTPLGISTSSKLSEQPVIVTILRAGLPLHIGLLNYFDKAENGFVGAYRKHHKNNTFEIALEYLACPDLTDKTLILCDPMLATGSSLWLTYEALIKKSKPKHTHFVTAIASKQGVSFLKSKTSESVCTFWCGAVDDELTAQSYIVPGLGDAGDLAFGEKI